MGSAWCFCPREPTDRKTCEDTLEAIVAEEGQTFLGWRDVPTDNSTLGETAIAAQPVIRQFFVGRGASITDALAF